jgi:hypothetical protein
VTAVPTALDGAATTKCCRGRVSLALVALLLAYVAVPAGAPPAHERAMFAPIWDIASLHGYGPRVAEPAFGLIGSYLWSAPYEEVRLKGR